MNKILIIDDSLFTLKRHAELVKQAGLHPVIAKGGEEGIKLFEETVPSIVLCDIMMPDMDGREVLEVMKEINPNVFLYFVTAELTESVHRKAMELGAKGIIEKPLTLETIKKIWREYQESLLNK